MAFCLRWGIAGAGKISSDFCSAMKTLPTGEHQITAVAARSVENALAFAEKFGCQTAYGSYQELANDPDVDIVYIGTIHITHVEISMMMLNAGKHVICEKPMAFNLKQVKNVIQLAREKNLFFMEAIWSRCFPNYKLMKKEISEGKLGEVQVVTVKFCIPIKDVPRLKRKDLGGGTLMDIGIYPLQLACMVYDEMPVKITADGVLNDEGVDDGGSVILKYKDGQMASLTWSGKTHVTQNSASINGTKDSIEIADYFWCPPEIKTPTGLHSNELPEGPIPYNFPNSGGLRYQADDARRCIMEGKKECDAFPHRHSEMIMAITDEIRKQIGVKYDVD